MTDQVAKDEKSSTPLLKKEDEKDSLNAKDVADSKQGDGPFGSRLTNSLPFRKKKDSINDNEDGDKRNLMQKAFSGPKLVGKSVVTGIEKIIPSKKNDANAEEGGETPQEEKAVEGPIVGVSKAFKRPRGRKYEKTPDAVDENKMTTVPEDEVSTIEETDIKKPVQPKPSKREVVPVNIEPTPLQKSKEIIMGPFMSFLLCDSTLVMAAALTVGIFPTIWKWDLFSQNHIPLAAALGWAMAAHVIGQELGRKWGPRATDDKQEEEASSSVSIEKSVKKSKMNHSIFMKATRRFSHSIHFQDSDVSALTAPPPVKEEQSRVKFSGVSRVLRFQRRRKGEPRQQPPPPQKSQQEWKKRLATPRSSILVQTLNQDQTLQLPGEATTSSMGSFDIASTPAESLFQKSDVEPLLPLRGMDIFLSSGDGAEDDIGNHPFVINGGLRDVSSCLVNVLLPWGNMLIYFQLPEWYDEEDGHEEKEDDPENVKALKRFLKGDNEYKSQRLRLMPSIVAGPRIVRMLAPSHTEIPIPPAVVPVTYNIQPESMGPSGKKLSPLIEVEMDCMSSKAVRTMAGVFKRNLQKLTLDLAVLIRSPENKSDEPNACIGMWRFDKIDVDSCPVLPQREVTEEEEFRRTSVIVGLPPEEIKRLVEVSA